MPILDMIRMLGAMVDAGGRAEQLVIALEARLAAAQSRGMLAEAAKDIL
jgi:ABC-type Fe3+-hydroxamate transport system substrate-binding protein